MPFSTNLPERAEIVESSTEFGRLIRETRRAQELTQAQLASAAQVGVRFIIELEHGKTTCELNKALQVTRKLGIRLLMSKPADERRA
jgi:y4mF family transcriptional regulator